MVIFPILNILNEGVQWLSGRVLDSRGVAGSSLTGGTVVSMSKTH